MLKAYYRLTKPGIIYGNVLTGAAGFLLGSRGDVDFMRLLAVLGGMALVIGSACVINNYIDRDIDAKMARTKKRALVSGEITGPKALVYAGVLGAAGFAILATQTNVLTLCIGIVGFIDYVVLYTWSKRHTTYATLIGSISGATPITAGYTAAAGTFVSGHLLGLTNSDPALDTLRAILAVILLYVGFGSRDSRAVNTALLGVGLLYVGMGTAALFSSTLGGLLPSGLTGFDVAFHLITGVVALAAGARHHQHAAAHS